MQVDFTYVMWLFKRVCWLFSRTCLLGCFCRSIFKKRSRDISRSLLTGSPNRSGLLFTVFFIFQLGGKHCRTVSIFWLCLHNSRGSPRAHKNAPSASSGFSNIARFGIQTLVCSWLRFGGWKIAASLSESKHQKGKTEKKNLFISSQVFLKACSCKCFYLNDLNLNLNVFI